MADLTEVYEAQVDQAASRNHCSWASLLMASVDLCSCLRFSSRSFFCFAASKRGIGKRKRIEICVADKPLPSAFVLVPSFLLPPVPFQQPRFNQVRTPIGCNVKTLVYANLLSPPQDQPCCRTKGFPFVSTNKPVQ